ncbi:MAG: iron ABC transporter substrate-binding protein [Chloroflexi bacterium]|nr:iron ABC transporter substrate-binding protein [Chloroflexota bacterium]
MRRSWFGLLLGCVLLALMPLAASAQEGERLVVYSGRTEGLIGPILQQFVDETGVQLDIRYGGTAEMAATILEEGDNSPADVFIAQDAGALGALAAAGRLSALPSDILERVPSQYQSSEGLWVGLSGRARVLVYNTNLIQPEELPDSILDLTAPEWQGRIGWAPTNASLQANVTAMRLLLGEDATRDWLEGMVANGAVAFENNDSIVQAVINGEIPAGLVNHYYVFEFKEQFPDAPIALHHFAAGDVGALVNVAGAGVVSTSQNKGLAQRLILYLLGKNAQTYFANTTGEYPLIEGVPANPHVTPLDQVQGPEIDLSQLNDLQTTLDLMRDTGALP